MTPITVADAVAKYGHLGLTRGRLDAWFRRGHIDTVGRVPKSSGRGGQLLFDEDDIIELLQNPPRVGRPTSINPPKPGRPTDPQITVSEAATKYADRGLTAKRLYNWLQRRHLAEVGRVLKSSGRGNQVLLDEDDIVELLANPSSPGRKPMGVDENMVTAAIAVTPITVADAVAKYGHLGLTRDRLNNWFRRGHIDTVGRVPKSSGRGGQLLFDEDDIIELLQNPPRVGRPTSINPPN